MQLRLEVPGPPRDAVDLTDWTVEDEIMLRSVHPDFAEAAIFEVVAAV